MPSALTNQIVTYCLGIATGRYGIDVHAFCFMSTHYHLVATDPRGELPEFTPQTCPALQTGHRMKPSRP
ncbi:MAG: hypothetical protein KAI47_10415 [Deltaproteobacteria bacterium]|nr:hypothetical protein [Deltaproteobacteria bacterium]